MLTWADTPFITSCTTILCRHWSPECESYSGGDALLGALEEGWRLVTSRKITQRTQSQRPMIIHIVWLENGEKLAIMRLVGNPYITRLLHEKQHLEIETATRPLVAANF